MIHPFKYKRISRYGTSYWIIVRDERSEFWRIKDV